MSRLRTRWTGAVAPDETRAGLLLRACSLPVQTRRVAPEIFERVEAALFRVEDVHDHLHVIEHDPLAGGKAVHGRSAHTMILLEPRLDLAGDRFQLRLGRCGAKDEELGEGRNLAQIEDNDVLRLLVRSEVSAGLR